MPGSWVLPLLALFAAESPPALPELVLQLRTGGYVLFVHHMLTNPDQADIDPLHLDNVAAQRHLTDAGRQQARTLGEGLRALKVPVGKVVASRFHRAQETAKLLGFGPVTASADVTEGGVVVSPRENQRRAAVLRTLLGTTPPAGTNVLIVSHRANLQDAAGRLLADMDEGEVSVFEPLGGDKFKLVARVPRPETWAKWAKQ